MPAWLRYTAAPGSVLRTQQRAPVCARLGRRTGLERPSRLLPRQLCLGIWKQMTSIGLRLPETFSPSQSSEPPAICRFFTVSFLFSSRGAQILRLSISAAQLDYQHPPFVRQWLRNPSRLFLCTRPSIPFASFRASSLVRDKFLFPSLLWLSMVACSHTFLVNRLPAAAGQNSARVGPTQTVCWGDPAVGVGT